MAGYFLLVSLVTIVSMVAQLGLPTSVVRFTAESLGQSLNGRAAGAIRGALLCGLASGVLAAGTLALTGRIALRSWFALDFDGTIYALAGIWVAALVLAGIVAESFRGLRDSLLAAVFGGALSNGLLVVLLIAGLLFPRARGLHEVLALAATAAIVNVALGSYLLRGKLQGLGPARRFRIGELLAASWPLMIASLAIFVVTQADLWIAARLLSKEEVALYGAAARMVQLVLMPILILNLVLLPLVAEMQGRNDWAGIERLVRAAAALAGGTAAAVLAVLMLFAPELLRLAFGPFYAAAAVALLPLCAGQVVNAFCGGAAPVMMMSGAGRSAMAISLVCGAWLLIAGPMAARTWGIGGLAAVAGSSTALHGLACMLWLRRRRRIWTFPAAASVAQAWRALRDAALGPRAA
jgi:O-antigen/teichoic acid export membrane protein